MNPRVAEVAAIAQVVGSVGMFGAIWIDIDVKAVRYTGRTSQDSGGPDEPTSQAEYAGSIPVIGST